ncbi:hypothetical protein BCV70DRAFT_185987 [Testicularia cyperi]|uniref:25S rRNA (uridine-N(3))-methyltransferase BMT5-like domain-containing protein n=1 Tax=Testicularia cyperi TaxID=1882483 RepID=A0A317XXU5_9BASI|nr:hypothetical protein BCV70DRAFT_185987 [Testicularia cyperi]
MPKKKGNLKAALHGHLAQQDQRAREKAAQDAARRKALSIGKKSNAPRTRPRPSHASTHAEEVGTSSSASTHSNHAQPNVAVSKKRKRNVQPFARDDTILIVGEANFSFTLSLLLPPRSHPASQILATAYDSEVECYAKYPDAQENVATIRRLAGRDDIVAFGVDAGQLGKYKQVTGATKGKGKAGIDDDEPFTAISRAGDNQRRWSKVWFGFPHVGAGHKDETRNVLANQLLLLRFLISVAPYLTQGPVPGYAGRGDASSGSSKQRRRRTDDNNDDDVTDEEEHLSDTDSQSGGGPTAGFAADGDAESQAILDSTNAHVGAVQPFRPPNRRGSVLITLRNAAPYTLWEVANLAKRLPQMLPVIASSAPALPKGVRKPTLQDLASNGLSLKSPQNLHSRATSGKPTHNGNSNGNGQGKERSYHLWRSFEFDPADWRGYEHRRTIGWINGISTGDNEDLLRSRTTTAGSSDAILVRASKAGAGECRTWEFGLE